MRKLLLLLSIPIVCFGQGPFNEWFNGKDKITYYDSSRKQAKYHIQYYYDEYKSELDYVLDRFMWQNKPFEYENNTYWSLDRIKPTTVFRTARSFYKDGSLARIEKRILDIKNSDTRPEDWQNAKKIGFNYAGNVYKNHHTILWNEWKNELEYDYYVYDGVTTIYDSYQSTWMYKFFWISGWYIDVWNNEDWTLWVRYRPEEKELNREIGNPPKSEIDYYDIESLVKIFIEDCINNNLILPFFDAKWYTLDLPVDPDTGKPIEVEKDPNAPEGYHTFYVNFVPKIKATFESLDGNSIGLSYGYMDDNNIIIKIDPTNWEKSSLVKRWYLLYHELGHDILNLEHGEGGKMMFNFADKEYTWENFIEDRKTMFDIYKSKYNLILKRKREQATFGN